MQVDVIVNSVSASLDLQKGFVSKELVKKAGVTIQKECHDQHKEGINIGNITVTSAGNLKNHKNIYHVALYTSWIFNGNLSIQVNYCEIIINHRVLIFTDFEVHLKHENNPTKYSQTCFSDHLY